MKERPKQGRHKSTDQLGITYHYLDGVLHREDGPSIESQDGYREWWFNGERHREMALLVNGRMAPRSGFSKEFNTLKRIQPMAY